MEKDNLWIDWCIRLQAIAQNGLEFAQDHYDRVRYEELRTIASEMLSRIGNLPPATVRGIFAGEKGYATPKVDVRGVAFRDDKILLVRERADGKWTLPGGWADPCASPAENVVREMREESGFEARPEKVLAISTAASTRTTRRLPSTFIRYSSDARSLEGLLEQRTRPTGPAFLPRTSCLSYRPAAPLPGKSPGFSNTTGIPLCRLTWIRYDRYWSPSEALT